MDLLVGVQMSNVLLKLYRVKRGKGAKVTAKLVAPWVTETLVLEENCFVGTRKITERAVVGEVCPIMSLHVCLFLKNGSTGMVTTFHRLHPMHFTSVSKKFFAQGTLESTTILEAGHWLVV